MYYFALYIKKKNLHYNLKRKNKIKQNSTNYKNERHKFMTC